MVAGDAVNKCTVGGSACAASVVLDDEGVEVDAKEREVVISTGGPQGAIPVEVD